MKHKNLKKGIFFIIVAFLLAAVRSAFSKELLRNGIPIEMILIFQAITALLLILPWAMKNWSNNINTANIRMHILRGTSGFFSLFLFIWALEYTTIAKAILLNNSSPLFIPIIGVLLFRRKISVLRIIILLAGFLGITLILKPSRGNINMGDILALISGVLAAFSIIFVRFLQKKEKESTIKIIFYYIIFVFIFSSFFSVGHWKLPSSPILWFYMLVTVITYTLFLPCFTQALKYGPAFKISPFIYFGVIFAGLIDWAVWNKVPDIISFIGMIIVIASAAITTRLK